MRPNCTTIEELAAYQRYKETDRRADYSRWHYVHALRGKMICVLNVSDDISLNVEPGVHLERGMSISISCRIRYGGPAVLSQEQEPSLELTLDNEPSPLAGHLYYQASDDTDSLHTKTLV